MSDELKAAMINARCTTAMIRAMGMQAENQRCALRGVAPQFLIEDFTKVIEEEGTHWNSIVNVIQQ
jgi:hypothetical protein